ncbi:MAG TPA: hypothetical protein VMX96_03915 [Dehalococcoidia bacterium]|nr:hypothetical protein [Dehalococcoidia bacterium]
MPEWKIHDKWAERMGIPSEISSFINNLIDFPKKCQEYINFCEMESDARIYSKGRPTSMTAADFTRHDSSRTDKNIRAIQLKFLRQKGQEFVRAWYLHNILDYIKWWLTEATPEVVVSIEDMLQDKRLQKKIGDIQDPELQSVRSFVFTYKDEILQDCK